MRISTSSSLAALVATTCLQSTLAFVPASNYATAASTRTATSSEMSPRLTIGSLAAHEPNIMQQASKAISIASLSLALLVSCASSSFAATASITTATTVTAAATTAETSQQQYDGFAEYAKENQMEKSDVSCFINKCGDQTKNLFSNPRGIKGVSCLGRCKGEQSCATRCFAEFGSEDLNNWLSCTIEKFECVKVPKNVDNSAENRGYTSVVEKFDESILVGQWFKTDGLNPNYDLFDCQSNNFEKTSTGAGAGAGAATSTSKQGELDMGISFRVSRPTSAGGGYWENELTEHMVVDSKADDNPTGRTMHTAGNMYGLSFDENWYILGQSDGTQKTKGTDGDTNIPPFIVVAYKGHTLQGNYEGSFIYAKERILPSAAVPAVTEILNKNGIEFKDFTRIDNSCSTERAALNDESAGTGTSTTDWIDLVVGEGGVVDWIVPGWRGEYKNKK